MEHIFKRTWAEIHLDRLRYNYTKLSSLISEPTQIMAVVKANGYGHDDIAVARCLSGCGVKHFAVSNLHEAMNLRKGGISGDILILSYTPPEYARELSENDIITAVISEEHARDMALSAAEAHVTVRCHIKLDTGMGRVGLSARNINECADEAERIARLHGLAAEGVFTHFSVADSDDSSDMEYTDMQKQRFFDTVEELERRGLSFAHVHCLNSAGAAYHFDNRSTLARFGIMLYGLHPNSALAMPVELKPVMELKAAVSQVKEIKKGEYVSYGRRFAAPQDMKIAVIPIGYADGYPRLLSNRSEVVFDGKKLRTIGNICMDQMMLDVSGCENIRCGDIVTVMGEKMTADTLADLYGTLGYEIVCGISKRVPRVIMDNGRVVSVLEY